MTPRVLAFAGSARAESLNRKLIAVGAAAARAAGADVTLVELRDFDLPLYDGDIEAAHGLPDGARRLKALFVAHDALLLSCPEHNSSITALLKNTIDWVSRAEPGEPSLMCFKGRTAALLAASPGALGGLRGLVHVRAILGNLGVLVLPAQLAVPRAHQAFGPDGKLADAKQQASVESIAAELVRVAGRLAS